MGTGESKQFSAVREKYDFKGQETDRRFGEVYRVRDRATKKEYYLKTRPINPKHETNASAKIAERASIKHTNLNGFVQSIYDENMPLTDFDDQVFLLFEIPPYDLEREIESRAKEQNHFHEQHLWSIARQVWEACIFLSRLNIYHGDIQPRQIFTDGQGQRYYVTDNLLIRYGDYDPTKKVLFHKTYPSPEELVGDYRYPQKIDTWGLGCSLLHASLLRPVTDIYMPNSTTIDRNKLEQYLGEVERTRSPNFRNFVGWLLSYDVLQRPDWNGLMHAFGQPSVIVPQQVQNVEPQKEGIALSHNENLSSNLSTVSSVSTQWASPRPNFAANFDIPPMRFVQKNIQVPSNIPGGPLQTLVKSVPVDEYGQPRELGTTVPSYLHPSGFQPLQQLGPIQPVQTSSTTIQHQPANPLLQLHPSITSPQILTPSFGSVQPLQISPRSIQPLSVQPLASRPLLGAQPLGVNTTVINQSNLPFSFPPPPVTGLKSGLTPRNLNTSSQAYL